MQIVYNKAFLRDLSKVIPAKRRAKIEEFVFEILPSSNTLFSVGNIEKMQGYKNYYKARFGDYRIGIYMNENILELKRVLNRKEIYKFFP